MDRKSPDPMGNQKTAVGRHPRSSVLYLLFHCLLLHSLGRRPPPRPASLLATILQTDEPPSEPRPLSPPGRKTKKRQCGGTEVPPHWQINRWANARTVYYIIARSGSMKPYASGCPSSASAGTAARCRSVLSMAATRPHTSQTGVPRAASASTPSRCR